MTSALALVPAILAALAAVACGIVFVLSFAAWMLCEPAARVGRYAPRPWLALAAFTLFATATYFLLP